MSELSTTLIELLDRSQEVGVLVPTTATLDELAVAASLVVVLRQVSKSVRVATPKSLGELHGLVGLEEVATELGNQNLLVSFDYSEEKVDKISYHIGEETKKFYLTIKPKKGVEPLDPSTVVFSRSGAEFDLLLTVGVTDLESLDQLYLGYEDVFQNTQLVSINTYETSFGSLKISQGEASSLSEVVASLLTTRPEWISPDVATNLLYAVESATRGLQSLNTSAETLQVAASLLRAGAQRRWASSTNSNSQEPITKKQSAKKPQETVVKVSKT